MKQSERTLSNIPNIHPAIAIASNGGTFTAPLTGPIPHTITGLIIATMLKGEYSEGASHQVFDYQPSWGEGLNCQVHADFNHGSAGTVIIMSSNKVAEFAELAVIGEDLELYKAPDYNTPQKTLLADINAIHHFGALFCQDLTENLIIDFWGNNTTITFN
jgi:hypothetical protein